MNILIVEDNAIKADSIKSMLDGMNKGVSYDCVLTPSEAIMRLRTKKYNFLILDMSLPAYSEESHSIGSLSGKQILQTMKHKKIMIPTVILTQWDVFGHHDNTISLKGLREELIEKFSQFLLGIIFWDSSSESWKSELVEYVVGFQHD